MDWPPFLCNQKAVFFFFLSAYSASPVENTFHFVFKSFSLSLPRSSASPTENTLQSVSKSYAFLSHCIICMKTSYTSISDLGSTRCWLTAEFCLRHTVLPNLIFKHWHEYRLRLKHRERERRPDNHEYPQIHRRMWRKTQRDTKRTKTLRSDRQAAGRTLSHLHCQLIPHNSEIVTTHEQH